MPSTYVCPSLRWLFVPMITLLTAKAASRQTQSNRSVGFVPVDSRRLLSYKVPEIQSNLGKHLGMDPGPFHALVPRLTPMLGAAELPRQDDIKGLDLVLGPFDTGAHHWWREAALEAADRVLDYGEIDK